MLECGHSEYNSGTDGIIHRLKTGRCKKKLCRECKKRKQVMKIVPRLWYK